MVRERMGGVCVGVCKIGGGKDLGGGRICISLVYLGMLNASADFCFFSVFIETRSDGNIYLEYYIWIFYEIVRPSQGGIHERTKYTRFSKSR